MADKNQLKIADQVDLADDDPFAELTRIMGFDPRQPARQAEPAADPAPASHEEAADEDDFSLDLEKELLGGFDLEEEQPAPVAGEAVEAPFEAHEFGTAPEMREPEAPEADFDFSAAFDEAMAVPGEPTDSVASEDEPVFDGDFDSAFAAAAAEDRSSGIEEDDGFDIGLTDEDIGGLDETPPPLPVTPEAVVADSEIGAELDAAMADLPTEAPSAETVDASFEAPALDEVAAAPAQEAGDFDHGLFDESDFRIEDDEVTEEPVPAIEAEPEIQPEIDESAFQFDDLFRSDEDEPAGEELAAAPEPTEELSFDGIDFGGDEAVAEDAVADNVGTAAGEEPVEEAPVAAEASLGSAPEPASGFEFSVPPFVPRKLPTSPMDVAAEEFRQRGAVEPAEPEFNLEDELNALLGNARTSQASIETDAPAASVDEPSMPEVTAYESEAYRPFASNVFGSAAAQSGPGLDHGAPEPVGFEAPEHPADIHDDLSWDLGDAVSETSPEPAEGHAQETYAQSGEIGEYVEDGQFDAYGEPEQAEDAYVQAFEAEEEPAPIELDDDFADEVDDDRPPESPYRDAFAGAGIGAAAAGYGSSYAQRPFQATAAAPGMAGFSPHRDPVVRGNPLKEDPLDVITQLAEKYSRKEPATPYGRAMSIASGASSAAYEPEEEESGGDLDISDAFEEPEVETVEVADQAIALADDLDIPELPEEELPPVSAYDDLDAEFSSLLNEMNADPQAGKPVGGYGDPFAGGFGARPYENNVVATPHGARAVPAAIYDGPEAAPYALDADDLPGSHVPAGAQYAADDYEYDPDFDQEIAPEHLAGEGRQKPKSRGLLLAGLIGGVALLGGVGAFALSFGGGDDAPAIVKADDSPVKVRPADPGGATVPNQESKVYETVAGERNAADAPQQETLVTTAEEPMDVMPPAIGDEQEATASGKSEDRIEQIVQEAANQTDDQIVAVAPRKVRTLVVKPDGTLVPREDEPEAADAASEQTEAITAATPEAAPAAPIPESTGALPAQTMDDDPSPALAPPPEEAQAAVAPPPAPQEATDEPEGQSEVTAAMPETVPIAPLRPADQPIDVVGEVKPDQVAAATTAAAGGGWAMQIASQPSEAAAQSSYENLARRYGGVLEGREVNIVRAEIPGKGTFWRVRVPAESRNEAINLCESYKSAGGNCFVSR